LTVSKESIDEPDSDADTEKSIDPNKESIDESDSDTDSESGLSKMFTMLQNIHDRVTRLESSLPRTGPSIAFPRRLE
jgi:hypothetical protein